MLNTILTEDQIELEHSCQYYKSVPSETMAEELFQFADFDCGLLEFYCLLPDDIPTCRLAAKTQLQVQPFPVKSEQH